MINIVPKLNNFNRIYLRNKAQTQLSEQEGNRVNVYKNELLLNVLKFDEHNQPINTEIPHLISIDIVSSQETMLEDKKLDGHNNGYGEMFQVVHGYHYEKEQTKNYVVSRQNASEGALVVYDSDYNQMFGFDGGAISFVDSDASRNFMAFIANKEVTERHSTGKIEELLVLNQKDFNIQSYHPLCKLHDKTEMLFVTCSDELVYLIEYRKFTYTENKDDTYSIYTIDPITGVRIGRGDLHLFAYDSIESKVDKKYYMANLFFEGNLTPEYGQMLYSGGDLYAPHGYHQVPIKVKVIEHTSCNSLMPCSQWLKYQGFKEEVLKPDEVEIMLLGIDSVGDKDVAISYLTVNEDNVVPDCGNEDIIDDNIWHLELPYSYHVDIINMGEGPQTSAFDSLDFKAFIRDFRAGCHVKTNWILSQPFAENGKRMTCTDKYIAIPMVLEPINFEVHPYFESTIVLFDKQTYAYVSYIELGKDYHINDSKDIIHPNPPIDCTKDIQEENQLLKIRMDIIILDIDSDCSQIAVSYRMKFKDYDQVPKASPITELGNPSIPEEQIYVEVFKDVTHAGECDRRSDLICERASKREWSVGTKKLSIIDIIGNSFALLSHEYNYVVYLFDSGMSASYYTWTLNGKVVQKTSKDNNINILFDQGGINILSVVVDLKSGKSIETTINVNVSTKLLPSTGLYPSQGLYP